MPTKFRPCIDLHEGKVKQIVGSSLSTVESHHSLLKTNFESNKPASFYSQLYQKHNLSGAHVIKLGPGNDESAKEALLQWPDNIQVGGGITDQNAEYWINEGRASHIIVTSWLFPNAKLDMNRVRKIVEVVGKSKLVIDLSCKKVNNSWMVATNKWQTISDTQVNESTLQLLQEYCNEFLIHAADVEGLCQGIDHELVKKLGEWSDIPCTYAGGANSISDLDLVRGLSKSKVDLTFGSSLDIFGGSLKFSEIVEWNKQNVNDFLLF